MQTAIHPTEVHSSQSATASAKMNVLRINFNELYRRHLGRHSQFGLNGLHLLAVYGIYFSIYSLAAITVRTIVPEQDHMGHALTLAVLSIPYLMLLIANIPFTMFLATALSVAILIAAAVFETTLPFWAHIILILLWHRLQIWSHNHYTVHRDMSEFAVKYTKGLYLFILLAIYELPVLLFYLLAGRRDWIR